MGKFCLIYLQYSEGYSFDQMRLQWFLYEDILLTHSNQTWWVFLGRFFKDLASLVRFRLTHHTIAHDCHIYHDINMWATFYPMGGKWQLRVPNILLFCNGSSGKAAETVFSFLLLGYHKVLNLLFLEVLLIVTSSDIFTLWLLGCWNFSCE